MTSGRDRDRPHDVSRETVGDPPAVAAEVFGHGLAQAVAFAELLATDGVVRGLIGPREVPRLWDRHLLNCGVVAPVFRSQALVYDVGSGAGLPGMVIALARPDLRLVLLEPLLRRTTFLEEAVRVLELSNVSVVRGRAEEFAGRAASDYVTSRAVAPLDRLLRWSAPLLRQGGELVALKGGSAAAEIAAATTTLSSFDAQDVRTEVVGDDLLETGTTLVRATINRPLGPGSPSKSRTARGSLTRPARRNDSSPKGRQR